METATVSHHKSSHAITFSRWTIWNYQNIYFFDENVSYCVTASLQCVFAQLLFLLFLESSRYVMLLRPTETRRRRYCLRLQLSAERKIVNLKNKINSEAKENSFKFWFKMTRHRRLWVVCTWFQSCSDKSRKAQAGSWTKCNQGSSVSKKKEWDWNGEIDHSLSCSQLAVVKLFITWTKLSSIR